MHKIEKCFRLLSKNCENHLFITIKNRFHTWEYILVSVFVGIHWKLRNTIR